MKTFILGILLLIGSSISSNAQESSITPPTRKLQLGVYGEAGKTLYLPKNDYKIRQNHFTAGLSARYRLSKRFRITAGFAISKVYGKQIEQNYYSILPIEEYSLGIKTIEYSLRIPIAIQMNICQQKFFVSLGAELYKPFWVHSTNSMLNTTTALVNIIEGMDRIQGFKELHLTYGVGYNFKAFKTQVFSVESNFKMYFYNRYYPLSNSSLFQLSPNLRLNWYFIK